eukprot:677859-Pyramimonas_sp.AAC.1
MSDKSLVPWGERGGSDDPTVGWRDEHNTFYRDHNLTWPPSDKMTSHITKEGLNQRQVELAYFLDFAFGPVGDLVNGRRVDFFDAACSLTRLIGVKLSERQQKEPRDPWTLRPPTFIAHAQI